MDGSDRVNSSSTPTKFSASPKFSNSDGHDQSENQRPSVTDFLNSKKPKEMEKTVKKKVLMERNEASSLMTAETQFPEIPNFDPKPSLSQTSPLSSRVCDFDGNEENSLAADSSSRPYDPLTNYLSPRPKFLRYKPNRRLEIFLRREKDRVGEGNCGLDHSLDDHKTFGEDTLSDSAASSFDEEDAGMQNEESLEESEGEFDEIYEREEEERGYFTVKEMLRFLLIIASLVSCSLYMTSMNTSRSSLEVSEAFGSGFCSILNHTDELHLGLAIEQPVSGSEGNFWDEVATEAASKRNLEGGSRFVLHERGKTEDFMAESRRSNGENEGNAEEYGNSVEVEDTEQVREDAEEPQSEESSSQEMAAGEKNEVEFFELTVEDDGEQEKGEECEVFDKLSFPSEIPEMDDYIGTPKPSIFDGTDQENSVSDILTASGNEYKMVEAGDRKMFESITEEAENSVFEESKITKLERIMDGISSFGEISFLKELENLKSELIELLHTESLLKVVVGVSASSVILTCLVLSLQFKKERDGRKQSAVSPSLNPLLESPVVEAKKIITRESPRIKATCEKSSSEHIENVGSFEMMSFSIHSRDEVENFEESHRHEAPTVQFLSEFVVGEVSSSLKNKIDLKNRMIEAEGSSLSVSVEEKPVSKTHSGPGTSEKDLSEFSAVNSPSYGSFTTLKKIVKKEVGGDGEVNLITTPVRRSTRIRNRIASP